MTAFEHTFVAGWAHMDSNGHMRNTAFVDLAVDTRLLYLASAGFSAAPMTSTNRARRHGWPRRWGTS